MSESGIVNARLILFIEQHSGLLVIYLSIIVIKEKNSTFGERYRASSREKNISNVTHLLLIYK